MLRHSLATLEGEQDFIMKNYGITLIGGNYATLGRQMIFLQKCRKIYQGPKMKAPKKPLNYQAVHEAESYC